MSTRAQRRDRAQARQGLRAADPVADRAAAAAAIYAEYSTAAVAAFERLNSAVEAAWSQWGTEHAAAWAERCRKLGELEDRKITTADPVAAAVDAERFTTTVEGIGQYGPATLAAHHAEVMRADDEAVRQAEEEDS